eukprot:259128-Alexandrium_andersonii.AAC.1
MFRGDLQVGALKETGSNTVSLNASSPGDSGKAARRHHYRAQLVRLVAARCALPGAVALPKAPGCSEQSAWCSIRTRC